LVVTAQLRRLLPAERSTEVANEDEDERARRRHPEVGEANWRAVGPAEDRVGRAVAGGGGGRSGDGHDHHGIGLLLGSATTTVAGRDHPAATRQRVGATVEGRVAAGGADCGGRRGGRRAAVVPVQEIGTVRWPDEGPTGSDEFFDLWVVTTLEILPRRADGLLGVEGESHLVLPF
jgi:hypothetical protein